MDLGSFLLGILSIIITIITFFISYKQTIGARKQRAESATKNIIKSCYINLIIDNMKLSKDKLDSIIEAKSYETNVRKIDLPSSERILKLLYLMVFEDDRLTEADKKKYMEILENCIQDSSVVNKKHMKNKNRDLNSSIAISIFSILSGVLVLLFSTYAFSKTFVISNINKYSVLILVISITTVLIILYLIRFNSKTTILDPAENSELDLYQKTEKEIINRLVKMGITNCLFTEKYHGNKTITDLVIEYNNNKYLVEVEPFLSQKPIGHAQNLIKKAENLKNENGNIKLILLVDKVIFNNKIYQDLFFLWDYIIPISKIEKLPEILGK